MSSKPSGRQAALTRLSIRLLSALLVLVALGCQKPEATGGPDMESPEDTFLWSDTSEVEIRIVEIRGDSVKIVELRSSKDTNRISTEKRYTASELIAWERDIAARVVQVRVDLIEALKMLTDSIPAYAGKE